MRTYDNSSQKPALVQMQANVRVKSYLGSFSRGGKGAVRTCLPDVTGLGRPHNVKSVGSVLSQGTSVPLSLLHFKLDDGTITSYRGPYNRRITENTVFPQDRRTRDKSPSNIGPGAPLTFATTSILHSIFGPLR